MRISQKAKAAMTTIETPMLTTSVTVRRMGPRPGMDWVDPPGSCSVPPPMNIWYTYRRASESPIETIISCTVPRPLRRNGRHNPASSDKPNSADTTTAKGIAIQIGTSRPTEKRSAASAPKVTISPWAKFESPVVPKTSETPIAASASMRPKLRPFTVREASWSQKLVVTRSAAVSVKLRVTVLVAPNSTSTDDSKPSGAVTPLGSSSSIVYGVSFVGTPMRKLPFSSVVASLSKPSAPVTVTVASGMGSPSVRTLPAIV